MNVTNNVLARLRPRSQHQYRKLPLFGRIMDALATWSLARGFATNTARLRIEALRRLIPWFQRRGKQSLRDLNVDDINEARRFFRVRDTHRAAAVQELAEFLRSRGSLRLGSPRPMTPAEREVSRFTEHLRHARGLADKTIAMHRTYLRQFLHFWGLQRKTKAIKDVGLLDIRRFLRHKSSGCGREAMVHVTATLRAFLRFALSRGALKRPLHNQLDTVRVYQGERLPQPLPWADFQRVLRRIDRSTLLGLRDFTILLLAGTYGLRRSEVAALKLDDIHWRTSTLCIAQAKTRQSLLLPLTDEVGSALAAYLKQRPQCSDRRVFLRHRAPIEPLAPMGVGGTLKRAVRVTGVKLATTRFHSLRHAAALRFLRLGASLKSISDVLGHRDPNSTADYLRLDLDDLRSIALPLPKARAASTVSSAGSLYVTSPTARQRVTAPVTKGWQSFLARPLQDYLILQRSLGRGYQREEWILRGLDYFLTRHCPHARTFKADQFADWAAGLRRLSPTSVRARLLCVRKFCQHRSRTNTGVFVPNLRIFPKALPAKAPYLLSPAEVARLLVASTQTINPSYPNLLRPQTMRLGLALMFCCGLRRGEVLHLQLKDIDLAERALRVNQTKFHKSRLVPLSASVAKELSSYLRERQQHDMPMEPTAPLLWNGRYGSTGGPLSQTAMTANWFRICQHAQVFDHRGRPPRIHDLRHSFAVEVLRRGYESGRDAQATLPRLARYMGHVSPAFTHYYLKFSEPIRQAASQRFRSRVVKSLLAPGNPPLKGGVA